MRNRLLLGIAVLLILPMVLMSVSASSMLSYSINISDAANKTIIESNQVNNPSALLVISTDVDATCRYSTTKGQDYDSMSDNFELEYGTLHKRTISNLIDGQYKAYVKCKNQTGFVSQELEIVYAVSLPITAQITLENGANIKDGKTTVTLTTSKVPKTTPSLSYTTDGSTFKQVPLAGQDKVWTGYIIIPSDRDNEVGNFKFQARDLEDNIGTEISSGAIFTIDTIAPNALLDIDAQGISKGINLTWKTDEDKLTYNIYKSTSAGVSYSNFYKKVNKNSYIDTDVQAKVTYYYRVSSIDSAGNEGPLSNEVYTISTLTDSQESGGLDLRYVGLVDTLVDKIDEASSNLLSATASFSYADDEEKEMFDYLKLSNSISSAKTALTALRAEVSGYTSQSLSKADLDKKLNAAEVKLGIIRASIPQSLSITDQVKLPNTVTENDMNTNLLEIKPALDYDQLNKLSKESLKYLQSGAITVQANAYNVEVTYLDTSQKTYTVISKDIDADESQLENTSIIEVIPKDIAQSSKDLTVYNRDYTVLKDDPILSFSPNTKQIVYFVKESLDLASLGKPQTMVVADEDQDYAVSKGLNGYLSFSGSDIASSQGMYVGIFLIIGLVVYYYFIRSKKNSIKLDKLEQNINELNEDLHDGNINGAVRKYSTISELYRSLPSKDKHKVYPELDKLHHKLMQAKSHIQKHKTPGTFFAIFIGLALILAGVVGAIGSDFSLMEGKNNVTMNYSTNVEELVRMNPYVESVTYYDENDQTPYAYINIFGGIGKPFIMEQGKQYEVVSRKNASLLTALR